MRLAGQQKGGFYPAPPEAVNAALRHIDCPKHGSQLLDPCAGEAAAVLQLAEPTKAKAWAIELDEGRGAIVAEKLPDTSLTPCSVFGVKCQGGYFDWLWVNPPYDDELGGGSRTEHNFLSHVSPWLRPGGLLCFVVPSHVVSPYSPSLKYLRERYDEVYQMSFPQHCRRFREIVVFGYKRDRVRDLDKLSYGDPNNVSEQIDPIGYDMVYRVPAGPGPRVFVKNQLTDLELGRALATSPLQKHLKPPAPLILPQPPLPVQKGHLAMLLASGHMDGLVNPPGEQPHVVRGTATKEQYLKEESVDEREDGSTTTKQVFAEKIVLTVRVLTAAGDLRTLKQE